MKSILNIIAISFLSLLLINSCKSPEEILPEGNVKSLNTVSDDFAPVQKPLPLDGCGICGREFLSPLQNDTDGILPAKEFLDDILPANILDKADAITYLDDKSGFFSLSHPGMAEEDMLAFPLNFGLGGTDLFGFEFKDGKYLFTALDPLNSFTWDSHPFAIMNENCDVLLIWSSDRNDPNGFSMPYKNLRTTEYRGNTDLFYAFRINNEWSAPKNLNLIGDGINTKYNEESPYLFCACYRPVLIFSSDREGSYDLYKVNLWVDIENQTIAQNGDVEAFPSGNNNINSEAKEFFPYVPYPISEEPSENDLYFSSDRYRIKTPINREQDTLIKNVGGFDIYRFPLTDDMKCTPPKLFYEVVVLDTTDPYREIKQPLVRLTESGNAVPQVQDKNNATFRLFPGKQYMIEGSSEWDKIDCIPGEEKTISHYSIRNIRRLEPEIRKRDSIITFTEFVERRGIVRIDTVTNTFLVTADELPNINASIAKTIRKKEEMFEVETEEIIKVEEVTRIDTVVKTKKMELEDIIQRFDTTYTKVGSDVFALSEKTKRLGNFSFTELKRDTTISDTVYLWPNYYYFPPCEWKYITLEDYRKNVPYFQTGFWEVNTGANIRRHIPLLKSSKFKDASFIELQPQNLYFGYLRQGISDEKKEWLRIKYDNRAAEYRQYAKQVDENLDNMSLELCEKIMPTFDELSTKSNNGSDKLLIIVNAYSDIRPITSSSFISDSEISYIAAKFDTNITAIESIYDVRVKPGASLDGESNDLLSKLRAYFGYMEVLDRFKKCDIFQHYLDNDQVLLPHLISSVSEFEQKYAKSKIVFLIEGRQVDPSIQPAISGYVGKPNDYKTLDVVRRIDVILKRVLSSSTKDVKNPECCRKPDKPPFVEEGE
jgi:hypothetical protein